MKKLVKLRIKHSKFFGLSKKKRILLLALGLSLCSGNVLAATETEFQTPEYYASSGLDVINAASAYAKGYSGKGIILGVCDQPPNFLHPEFTCKNFAQMISDSWIEPGVYDWSKYNHGTHVAGIMAAGRDDIGMHGVAYNADIAGVPIWFDLSGNPKPSEPLEPYDSREDIKIINNSWSKRIYFDEFFRKRGIILPKTADSLKDFGQKITTYLSTEDIQLSHILQPIGDAAERGKLLIFSAGNNGHPTPAINSFLGWFDDAAKNNLISVTALNNNLDTYTRGMSRQADGSISGDWMIANFSDGAKYAEEHTLAAPGHWILSTNADFANTGTNYILMEGTSMAAPFVSGAAGLVEEAFPYMSGKQIADTLLSTANSNIKPNKNYFVTEQYDGDGIVKYNIFYFDGRKRTTDETIADVKSRAPDLEWPDELETHAYYNVPLQAFIGQGVVDAGKAVNGPGALNARRLASADVTDAYSADGTKTVMYPIDTKGYDSTWSNDIKEIKVGKIAADSAEADLAERYKYYDTNWISNPDAEAGARRFTELYVNAYNNDVENSGMEGLHVGLIKNGEGSLSLTGNNTYEGASVAKGGTLSIDGSVVGDAYSVDSGTIAGRGTIGGTLYNRNIAVAGDSTASGNLTMQNLVSTGTLVSHVTAKDNSRFIVHNTADVTGSTVLLNNALPDESRAVVTAGTLTGNVVNTVDKPLATTGMLSTYGTTTGNTLTATAVAANNLGAMDGRQEETYWAMNAMYKKLDANRREEMRTLYNLDATGAKKALSEISSADAPQIMSLVQQNSLVAQVISDRLSTAFATSDVEVPIPMNHFADDNESENKITIPMELPVSVDHNAWVKFTKHWGEMKSGANYHGQGISGGYDKQISPNWRLGTFVSYNAMSYGAESASGNIYDTRFGFYGGYHKEARDAYIYLDYGHQRNRLNRSVLGKTAAAKYNSNLWELGGEYKYDLHAKDGKIWHVSPYVGMQFSYLQQNGYSETGAGSLNHHASAQHNTYFAMQTGVEFKRYLSRGSYGIRLGVKHAFAGADPNMSFHYEGDATNRYILPNSQDKTHFIMALSGNTEFSPGWQLDGEVRLQRGSHDKDLSASVMLRREW